MNSAKLQYLYNSSLWNAPTIMYKRMEHHIVYDAHE